MTVNLFPFFSGSIVIYHKTFAKDAWKIGTWGHSPRESNKKSAALFPALRFQETAEEKLVPFPSPPAPLSLSGPNDPGEYYDREQKKGKTKHVASSDWKGMKL